MRRALTVAAFLSVLLALSWQAHGASPATTPVLSRAESLFARAEADFSALRASAQAQRQRQNYVRVLEAYRRVFEKYPATRAGDQALMRSGELLTLLFRWTGQEGDLNRAQNYYQRLVQTSPKSPLLDDALLAIAYLFLDQFKDPIQAWLRFRDVTVLAPAGDKAAEAKRQLKRLSRYATVTKPQQAAGGGNDLSCPAPQPGSAADKTHAAIAATSTPPGTAAPPLPDPTVPPPPSPAGVATAPNRVRDIRHWSNPEYTRVVIDLERKTNFYSNLLEDRSGSGKPPRLYVDLFGTRVEERFCAPISVNDGILLGIRAGQYTPDSVRVVLEIDGLHTYRVFPMQNPFRIVIDVTGGTPGASPGMSVAAAPRLATPVAAAAASPPPKTAPAALSPTPTLSTRMAPLPAQTKFTPEPVPDLIPLPAFTPGEPSPATTAPSLPQQAAPVSAATPATFSGTAAAAATVTAASPAPDPRALSEGAIPSPPPSSGKPSLARQLGLGVRRVIIDAGHGAHDPGAIGVGGLQEKEVTLDLALRVRDVLQAAGYEIVLTRDRDVYLPLEERTALANTARGDLFLSLHCNASDAGNLSGVETYFLNLASNIRAMKTAARENSMAVANMSDLQQIVREIQNSKMDESSQFAARIQRSLHGALRRKFPDVKDLGVKQAPFYVLIGAQMPSVLAEVSFINHRTEGRRLADPAYRQLIAQAIADGVKRYVKSVKTATLGSPGGRTP